MASLIDISSLSSDQIEALKKECTELQIKNSRLQQRQRLKESIQKQLDVKKQNEKKMSTEQLLTIKQLEQDMETLVNLRNKIRKTQEPLPYSHRIYQNCDTCHTFAKIVNTSESLCKECCEYMNIDFTTGQFKEKM